MKSDHTSLPNLVIPEDKAKQKVQSQIERGQEIRNLDIRSEDDMEKARRERSKWSDFNTALLTGIFSDESVAERYKNVAGTIFTRTPSLNRRVGHLRETMEYDINRLEGIVEEIDEGFYQISAEIGESLEIGHAGINESKIFIVHGTDSINARHQLESLLTKWRLKAVILHEQSNLGQTIIEKFEEHADEVGCAIVLLTPDDEGRAESDNDWKPRARQNVIFELGFFFGKLGRGKTICLHRGDIEFPSDIHGIVRIHFDKDVEDASHKLRKELKAMRLLAN